MPDDWNAQNKMKTPLLLLVLGSPAAAAAASGTSARPALGALFTTDALLVGAVVFVVGFLFMRLIVRWSGRSRGKQRT